MIQYYYYYYSFRTTPACELTYLIRYYTYICCNLGKYYVPNSVSAHNIYDLRYFVFRIFFDIKTKMQTINKSTLCIHIVGGPLTLLHSLIESWGSLRYLLYLFFLKSKIRWFYTHTILIKKSFYKIFESGIWPQWLSGYKKLLFTYHFVHYM